MPQIARLNAYVSQSGLTKHTRLTASIVWKRGESWSRNFNTYHHGQTSYSEMFSESTESYVWVGVLMYGTRSGVNKRNSALLVAHWVQCVLSCRLNYSTISSITVFDRYPPAAFLGYSREDADVRYDAYMCNIMLINFHCLAMRLYTFISLYNFL